MFCSLDADVVCVPWKRDLVTDGHQELMHSNWTGIVQYKALTVSSGQEETADVFAASCKRQHDSVANSVGSDKFNNPTQQKFHVRFD